MTQSMSLDPTPAETEAEVTHLLEVRDLVVSFDYGGVRHNVVDHVDLSISRGETLGLVGESGSGKTMTALGFCGLAQAKGANVSAASITFDGRELTTASARQLNAVRGRDIGMIFQQPIRSLNPAFTVGDQIAEVLRLHTTQSRKEAWRTAVEMLDLVHIPRAEQRAHDYPHMFSGGMCQRVMIAMALACRPKLLIADEPTTALDVTVQARVLELLGELQSELGLAILFITHDLGVVAKMCDRVSVMYAGQIVETSPAEELFDRPRHPYTRGLLASVPRVGAKRLASIAGVVPGPADVVLPCRFLPRCPFVVPGRCDVAPVDLASIADGHDVRCVRHAELVRAGEVR